MILIGERSTLFQRIKFSIEDVRFLRYSATKWSEFSFQAFIFLKEQSNH